MRLPSGSERWPAATALLTDSEKTLTMLARRVLSAWRFAVTATYIPGLRSAAVMASCRRTRVVGVNAKLVPSVSVTLSAAALATVPSIRAADAGAGPPRVGLAAGVAASGWGLAAGAAGALAPPHAASAARAKPASARETDRSTTGGTLTPALRRGPDDGSQLIARRRRSLSPAPVVASRRLFKVNRFFPWVVALIALLAVFIDIPKHQFSFPFNCPGVCLRIGGFSVNQEIKTHLGLDLQGGTQLVLQMRTSEIPAGQSIVDYNERARRVIDRRINGLGVSEPVIQAVGDDKILLQLPGIDDIQQANEIATRQAKLEIKVPDAESPGQFKSLQPPLTGEHLNPTFVSFDQANRPVVNFEFTGPDSDRWVQLSKDFLNKPVQISLDGKQISAPTIQVVFTSGRGIIEGQFTTQSAKELSLLINSGALPVSLDVIQSSRVEPTLGRDSVNRSLIAGAVGLLLVT